MDPRSIGPTYCETPLVAEGFPLELANTLTSLVPMLLGLWALWWLYRIGSRMPVLYILAVLLFATGVGSTLWHGLRTPLALSFDVFPGLLFFLTFAFVWPLVLGNRWWGYATIAALFGLVFLLDAVLQVPGLEGYITRFVGPVVLVAAILIGLTYRFARQAAPWSIAIIGSALIAVAARTFDTYACTYSPIGSHFLWHIFLGIAALCSIVLVLRITTLRERCLER